MRYLTAEEVLQLHFQVIEDYGGSHGVRSEDRLNSVVLAPQQSVFGADQYVAVYQKAAVYMRNIIGDHPFADGNKRTGIVVASIFLMQNGYEIESSTQEIEDFAVKVATDKLDVPVIAQWLEAHSKKEG